VRRRVCQIFLCLGLSVFRNSAKWWAVAVFHLTYKKAKAMTSNSSLRPIKKALAQSRDVVRNTEPGSEEHTRANEDCRLFQEYIDEEEADQ
jgi:hypothetical protein